MTTSEILTLVFGTNTIVIAIFLFISSKNKETAKAADRLRDATIENIKESARSETSDRKKKENNYEKKITILKSEHNSLEERVLGLEHDKDENLKIILGLRVDVRSLEKVIKDHEALFKDYSSTLKNQFSSIDSLEDKLLEIAATINENESIGSIGDIQYQLSEFTKAIKIVKKSVRDLQRQIREEPKKAIKRSGFYSKVRVKKETSSE